MKRINKLAQDKYLEFSGYEGSQHIATEHAIYRILENVKLNKCKEVLEIGLGIGTVFSAVHSLDNGIKYSGTEKNDFCLKSLKTNLLDSYGDLDIYNDVNNLKTNTLDMVIIDGSDDYLDSLPSLTRNNCVLIIEGDRKSQEQKIKAIYPKSKYVHVISLKKNNPKGIFDCNSYQGGVKIFFTNPNIKQLLYYYKHRWLTFFKYKIRKIKS